MNRRSGLSKRLKVGVLCGGISSEREISKRSGRAVQEALKKQGFLTRCLDPQDPNRLEQGLRRIDLAFVALHGMGGEDGAIQRELEKRRIPFVGSNASSCQRTFNKAWAKYWFKRYGIPTPSYVLVEESNWKRELVKFPTPFFVKPVSEGSSIGIFCVESFEDATQKIQKAVRRYGRLLVEKKIVGQEYTVGIVGDRTLPVIELKPRRAFYDYEAKYTKGLTDYLVPAPIPRTLSVQLQHLALKAHRVLGLRDFSRVDLMVDRSGQPSVLEVNAIPGLTELSLLPKAAQADGTSFEELCRQLVMWAFKRNGHQRGKT